MNATNVLSLLFVLLLFFGGSDTAAGEPIKVVYLGGQSEGTLEILYIQGQPYVSLASLAREFGGSFYWAPITRKMVLRLYGRRLTISLHNTTVLLDDRALNLPVEPTFHEGLVCVPAAPFFDILGEILPQRLRWDPVRAIVVASPSETTITGLSVEERVNGTLISIATTDSLRVEVTTSEPAWLHLSLKGGTLDPERIARTQPKGDVRDIRVQQYEGYAQISLLLSDRIVKYDVLYPEEAGRIEVALRRPHKIEVDRERIVFHTVVVDPGHGGKDPGAIGPGGTEEKDVTLDIARRLAYLLERNLKVRTVMTRSTDEFVSLTDRVRIAQRSKGTLFISLHCNSISNRHASGTETYFLSEAKTEEAREVARRENASLRFERPLGEIVEDDFVLRDLSILIPDIVGGMASDQYLKESQDLAALVQSEIVRASGLEDRGVKQAGFYVMKGTLATMPSVLVEVAFLSNPYEEKLLKRISFRKSIARAIYWSIKAFKQTHEVGHGL